VIAARDALLDSMGVYQHHDAVTGTAKQYVADDYTLRHVKAFNANFDQYEKMINFLSHKMSGIHASYWTHCVVNNGTYLDCPVSYHINQTFVVAI
jgi:lysosomal alpha-mannosidase